MEETRITFEEGTRRIVLPQAVKQIMGWDEKTPVEIWLNAADDAVILKRHIVTCSLCGSTEDLHPVRYRHLCPGCLAALRSGK